MKNLVALLLILLTLPVLADTPAPGVVGLKGATDGTKIGNVGDSLKVNVTNGGMSSTVNQGVPAPAPSAWPVYLPSPIPNQHVTIDAAPAITGTVTVSNFPSPVPTQTVVVAGPSPLPVAGTIAVSNPDTNYALESGGHLASMDLKMPVLGQALAAAAVPVVLTAAQLATLTPLSTVTANAGTNLNTSALALESGHLASIDTKLTSPLTTNATLQAGSAIVGKVGIDQTTPGTTNGVVVNSSALPTGASTSANQTNGSQQTQIVQGGNTLAINASGGTYVGGISAVGLAPVLNPVPISGVDGGGLKRAILTDSTGISQVTLANTNKTMKMIPANLSTNSTTANQVVLTYTVTAGKTFYLQYADCVASTEAAAITATAFGTCALASGGTVSLGVLSGGSNLYQQYIHGSGTNTVPVMIQPSEPIPFASGTVLSWIITPAATTNFYWYVNIGGYEK